MLVHFDKTATAIARLFESESDFLNELLTEPHCSNEWLKLLFDTSIKHEIYFDADSVNRALKECDNIAADDEKALEWKELISNYIKQIPQEKYIKPPTETDEKTKGQGTSLNENESKVNEPDKETNLLLMSIRENDEKKDEEGQLNWADKFDLFDCYQQLSFDTTELEDNIARDEILIKQCASEMRPLLQRDFATEKSLTDVQNQINLLIQNQVNLTELGKLNKGRIFTRDDNSALGKNKSPMEGKNKYYSEMVALLRVNPHYFTRIIERIKIEDRATFAKTIVFDIYGDLYSEDEERLLLILLRSMLEYHIGNMTNIESILKPDAFITHMLTAFAKRGHALATQKSMFERPLLEMMSQTSLNIEVNPVKVYEQIIISYEAKMNKPWDGVRNPTLEEAKENKYVKRLIPPRIKQLEYICEHFLSRFIETVDEIPFGSRWICLQIAQLAQKKWPHIDVYQLGSLVGEYIYLCFVKPVIIDPQSAQFVDKAPSKTMRRNLILVCACPAVFFVFCFVLLCFCILCFCIIFMQKQQQHRLLRS